MLSCWEHGIADGGGEVERGIAVGREAWQALRMAAAKAPWARAAGSMGKPAAPLTALSENRREGEAQRPVRRLTLARGKRGANCLMST